MWISSILFPVFIQFSRNKGPRPYIWSRTLVNKVSDLVLGIFFTYQFLLISISTYMYNESIMHKVLFLNIMKPYFMTFFFLQLKKSRSQTLDQMSHTLHQYLVFLTFNVLVITHNNEICKDKLIQHLNIVVIVRCTIYDSVFMDCSLLIYPVFQSKVFLLVPSIHF